MKKILLVEDNDVVASIYSSKLAEAGFEVQIAVDGLEALKLLPLFMPDLVVLDLLMPKFSGTDVLKFMRGNKDLQKIRVIVLSNAFLGNVTDQISALGVQRSIVKSALTPAGLIETVRQVMEEEVVLPPSVKPPQPASATLNPAPPAYVPQPLPPVSAPRPLSPAAAQVSPLGFGASPTRAPGAAPAAEVYSRVGQEFLERVPTIMKELRDTCSEFLQAHDPAAEIVKFSELGRRMSFLTQMAAMAGYQRTAEMSGALEALLFEIQQRPGEVTDSARHTIAGTVTFIAEKYQQFEQAHPWNRPPAILAVDDDAVANRAVELALRRAKLAVTTTAIPGDAWNKLQNNRYNMVLLDIEMPGMDGLALCQKLRELPHHKDTPVIFVTGHSDFKTRAQSTLSGGNDLIAKPILPAELCVKVLARLLSMH